MLCISDELAPRQIQSIRCNVRNRKKKNFETVVSLGSEGGGRETSCWDISGSGSLGSYAWEGIVWYVIVQELIDQEVVGQEVIGQEVKVQEVIVEKLKHHPRSRLLLVLVMFSNLIKIQSEQNKKTKLIVNNKPCSL